MCVCVYLWQCVRRSQLALCCANFSAGVKRRRKKGGGGLVEACSGEMNIKLVLASWRGVQFC